MNGTLLNSVHKLRLQTYPRPPHLAHAPLYLATPTKGMSSCRETCVGRACGAARRNRYAAGSLPAARQARSGARRGETLLANGMRGRMAGSTAQGSSSRRSALIREAPDARAGDEAESWHARGGNGPHPQSKYKSARPCRPAPLSFLLAIGDSASRSRPPGPDLLS